VREPRKVLAEFGLKVPAKVQIRVHDSNADMRYMVLPMRPAGTESWDGPRLAELVTRDCLIGVAVPKLLKKPKPGKS
jgi:nitrile hydratase